MSSEEMTIHRIRPLVVCRGKMPTCLAKSEPSTRENRDVWAIALSMWGLTLHTNSTRWQDCCASWPLPEGRHFYNRFRHFYVSQALRSNAIPWTRLSCQHLLYLSARVFPFVSSVASWQWYEVGMSYWKRRVKMLEALSVASFWMFNQIPTTLH